MEVEVRGRRAGSSLSSDRGRLLKCGGVHRVTQGWVQVAIRAANVSLAIGLMAVADLSVVLGEESIEILASTEMPDVGNGTLMQPMVCPTNPRYVAFARIEDETRTVYIYDHTSRQRFRLASETSSADAFDVFSEEMGSRRRSFNGDFEWCPTLREGDDRSWFVIVSNEAQKVPGVLLGAIGERGLDRERTRLSGPGVPAVQPRWSPDGRELVFVQRKTTNFDL
ncbi:MAG: hypothetical protein FJY85_01855, partial [Deltaproteobacteria bacterium]|nr:hypothetical protein [Deltaproteobacteria bacterium]